MKLERREERMKADPVEPVKDPLEKRKGHKVHIDQFSLASRHVDDLSPGSCTPRRGDSFAGGN